MSERVTPPEAPGRAGLVLRNLLFTAVVPGLGGVYGPWMILRHRSASPTPIAWPAVAIIAIGLVLYLSCQWVFWPSAEAHRDSGTRHGGWSRSDHTAGCGTPSTSPLC